MPAKQYATSLVERLENADLSLRFNLQGAHRDKPELAGTLFTIRHGNTSSQTSMPAAVIQTGLPPLEDLHTEYWIADKLTNRHFPKQVAGGIHCLEFDKHLLLSASSNTFDTPQETTRALYQQLLRQCHADSFPNLLRVWNYMPNINHGAADNEIYRQFCIGRHQAFIDAGMHTSTFPAASALSHDAPGLLVYLIAAKRPGLHFENPQQQSAYEYPKIHGPKSPSFARATLAPSLNCLFISGTASISGHQSLHIDKPLKQLDLTLNNIEHLVSDICQRTNFKFSPAFYKVYIRHRKDFPSIKNALSTRLQNTPCIYLQADICRQELLLEIEAHYTIDD